MKSIFAGCAILVSALSFQLPAAQVASPVVQNAIRLYRSGKLDSTIVLIRNHLKKHGKDQETEVLIPIIMEALVRRNDYVSVHRLFEMYREKFPASDFLPRLSYLEGVALAKEERYALAVSAFSKALDMGVSATLDSMVIVNCEKIFSGPVTAEELRAVATSREINPRIIETAFYHEIVRFFSGGQIVKARSSAEEFRKSYPRSRYDSSVKEMLGRSRNQQKGAIQIGLLAPVSGDDADIGKKVTQGVQLVIDRYNESHSQRIQIVAYDTRGNMVESAQRARELIDDHHIPILIGPVLSHTATAAAAVAMGKDIVMISPTATDDGIAGLAPNIFQMNLTIGVLGRRIARYAIENLNIDEFAIIAPRNPYGMLLAESFKEEVARRSARLVAEEYFEEGTNDFAVQFSNVRAKLLQQKFEKMTMEKGIDFRSNIRITRADSIKWADSTLLVGGLFMPAEAEDVVMLAPQVAFHRIRTQMLGSSGWHVPRTIADGKRYVANALISTSFEIDAERKEWQDFRRQYKSRYNAEPDRIAALGFDAANLILRAIDDAGGSPVASRIAAALSKIQNYHGLSGTVSFDNISRANTEAAIMKVTESGFIRVQ